MDESQFILESCEVMSFIYDAVEEQDKDGLIDVDYNSDVLTIKNTEGVFVINKQTPKMEIWVSSPISGPHHFQHYKGNDSSTWKTNSGTELFDLLSKELQITFVGVHG